MRKLAIALALASTALATPALARDHSFYAGLEGGGMLVEDAGIDVVNTDNTVAVHNFAILDHKPGFDIDVIAGYDFGMVRLEGELGYKHAGLDEIEFRDQPDTGLAFGTHLPANGDASSVSFMINGLLDFGDEDNWSGYVGPGIGIAHAKFDIDSIDGDPADGSISDTRIAWQVVAGVRKAITPNIDSASSIGSSTSRT